MRMCRGSPSPSHSPLFPDVPDFRETVDKSATCKRGYASATVRKYLNFLHFFHLARMSLHCIFFQENKPLHCPTVCIFIPCTCIEKTQMPEQDRSWNQKPCIRKSSLCLSSTLPVGLLDTFLRDFKVTVFLNDQTVNIYFIFSLLIMVLFEGSNCGEEFLQSLRHVLSLKFLDNYLKVCQERLCPIFELTSPPLWHDTVTNSCIHQVEN